MTSRMIGGLLAGCAIVCAAPAYAQGREFNIPAGDLHQGLVIYARQSGQQVLYRVDDVRGSQTRGVRGSMNAEAALDALLAGTGFAWHRDSSGAIGIARGTRPLADGVGRSLDDEAEVVVTGTRIRGAPPSAPLITISRQEMQDAGQLDLGQAVRSVPQNFTGGQNPGIGFGGEQFGSQDSFGTSAVNLRGLGPSASLTLLNGRRLAYGGAIQGVNITSIPLAAVERIEILTDGSSAQYGSDAIAGVANVILRRDVDGVTISGAIGGATDGGYGRHSLSGTAGTSWRSGSFMIAGDFDRWSDVSAGQRDYTSLMNPAATLYPYSRRYGGLATFRQNLLPGIALTSDGLYSRLVSIVEVPTAATGNYAVNGNRRVRRVESFVISPTLEAQLPGNWLGTVNAGYGADRGSNSTAVFANSAQTSSTQLYYDNDLITLEAGAEGPLVALPSGAIRLALGGGYRSVGLNSFSETNGVRRVLTNNRSRNSLYGYGELFIPIVGPSQQISGIDRLVLSVAARYESVGGAGDEVTPKIGVSYAPIRDLTISATWSRSFKAPTLVEQYQGYSSTLRVATFYGATGVPATATALFLGSANPSLRSERSENWILSAALEPRELPGTRFEVAYFNIDYTDRIAVPIGVPQAALASPLYSNYLIRNPSADLILATIAGANGFSNLVPGALNPANVIVIIDNRNTNAARQKVSGIDFNATYSGDIGPHDALSASIGASYLRLRRQLIEGEPFLTLSGALFNPPSWRGRASVTYTRRSFTISAAANYIGSLDEIRPNSPDDGIGGQATFDITIRQRLRFGGLLNGLDLRLSAMNIFNAEPPVIWTNSTLLQPFDSANYGAIGRNLTFSVSASW